MELKGALLHAKTSRWWSYVFRQLMTRDNAGVVSDVSVNNESLLPIQPHSLTCVNNLSGEWPSGCCYSTPSSLNAFVLKRWNRFLSSWWSEDRVNERAQLLLRWVKMSQHHWTHKATQQKGEEFGRLCCVQTETCLYGCWMTRWLLITCDMKRRGCHHSLSRN